MFPGLLHRHRCGVCRAEWEHRAPVEKVSEETYDRLHTCPNGHLHEDNFDAGPPKLSGPELLRDLLDALERAAAPKEDLMADRPFSVRIFTDWQGALARAAPPRGTEPRSPLSSVLVR